MTGKPIMVNIGVSLNNSDSGLIVNNIIVSRAYYPLNQIYASLIGIVPPNGTYRLQKYSTNPPGILHWAELR